MKEKREKRKDEKTGSEAHYQPFGLHFQTQAPRDIQQRTEDIQNSFYTNTFNQIPSFCQEFRFDGVYKRVGNNIILSSEWRLKIQERKHETRNKPKEYLNLYKIRNGKWVFVDYISSLFKIEGKENTYWFDYRVDGKKVYYIMKLTDTTAKILGADKLTSLFTLIY
jgi:hypothetical protein